MSADFSVLMSLYIKENPNYFRECMESILRQTLQPKEIVIVKDGPLTKELEMVLEEYQGKNPALYTIVPLEKNQGLGIALAEGIKQCKYELVARMDTDDIAREDRFSLQMNEFIKNPKLDICGSNIAEFEDSIENIVAHRRVPTGDAEIKQYQKRRDAFNHMTVMYKKSTVIKAGNYQSCMLMEDSLLWVNMFLAGAVAKNIDDNLVYARVGKNMFERRGGFSYFIKYRAGRKVILGTGYISLFDYVLSLAIQLGVAIVPNCIRGWIYKKFLHQ